MQLSNLDADDLHVHNQLIRALQYQCLVLPRHDQISSNQKVQPSHLRDQGLYIPFLTLLLFLHKVQPVQHG